MKTKRSYIDLCLCSNNHFPHFKTKLVVQTYVEDDIKLSIYDCDEGTGAYSEADRMGSVVLEVTTILKESLDLNREGHKDPPRVSHFIRNENDSSMDAQLVKLKTTIDLCTAFSWSHSLSAISTMAGGDSVQHMKDFRHRAITSVSFACKYGVWQLCPFVFNSS